jgi:5-amino-6-(5-phosphoribosylamino)uracil reductase
VAEPLDERPYTVLSCCVSLDGYLDDGSERRLVLSNAADLDRVDELRASCDAILVGAATVRNDDPRLLVRLAERRSRRTRRGLPADPLKVTVTATAKLDPGAQFFTAGSGRRLVYAADPVAAAVRELAGPRAEVVAGGPRPTMSGLGRVLVARRVRRLLVEGGGSVLTQFLTQGLADELQLVVAPLFVGDGAGTRFVGPGEFPWNRHRRARLVESRPVGDVVLLRYALSDRCRPRGNRRTGYPAAWPEQRADGSTTS